MGHPVRRPLQPVPVPRGLRGARPGAGGRADRGAGQKQAVSGEVLFLYERDTSRKCVWHAVKSTYGVAVKSTYGVVAVKSTYSVVAVNSTYGVVAVKGTYGVVAVKGLTVL